MIPLSLVGLIIFFFIYKVKLFSNPSFVAMFSFGLFIPSLDFLVNIFLSIFLTMDIENIKYSYSQHVFHSIFTIIFIILLISILSELFNKRISSSFYKHILIGFFLYIALEAFFTKNIIYLFWPIIDSDLKINIIPILEISFNMNYYDFIFLFISLELIIYFLISKFLSDMSITRNLSSYNFLIINKWSGFQKKINLIIIVLGVIVICHFYINKNILLFLYIVLYTLSTVKYLSIIFKLNIGVKVARCN